ncbi:MAG: aldo/keto reductase [Candidatus Eremiobacter antarcticus]|nr:aldo/keto reductase [Candidatus Eremiobacteraeota bacterium]MBC5809004.1 aldo/keto reductase [Candidatus Eremiobacteraeota bacterium]PZR60321.1 MAG: aldo/keto reductase [Candidatus Eremiobacter sp. RRmetagenome_bin22]
MELRNLGSSGLRVSVVGLGCNNFGSRIDQDAAREVVDKAIDLGVTLFDTADIYGNRGGSERALGEILGERRKHLVLATKFGGDMDEAKLLCGASRRYVMSAVDASLQRLQTDWIDLYQVHVYDSKTPIEETMRALDDLVQAGKIRYIGCSNFSAWQVVDANWTAKHLGLNAFISCQDEYSLVEREPERELLPAMEALGLGLLPYFPLASGLLTGKYRRGQPAPEGTRFAKTPHLAERYGTEKHWTIVEQLREFAAQRGRSLLELAFSWLAAQPLVGSIIAGATKASQIDQNVRAVAWALSAQDLEEIDRLSAAD